ncbi:MAG: IS3 family transposase [Tissierellaceae bacterium]|nr:IS3 family transposase [Tissierellaceae bacterium]
MRKETSLSKVRQEAEYKTVDFLKDKGYPVTKICEVLNISRSAYYKHKNRIKPEKQKQDELLCSLITEYHSTFDGILGYRRMTMFINKLNHKSFSEGYIHRLMKHLGITARIRRKKVNRKRIKPEYIKENVLARDFTAKAPNEKWLTDVTEFSIPGDNRKLYLSPIMDLYDNSIIEYELSYRNNNYLVFSMLDKATQKHPDAKPIFHSDRGFQYTGHIFRSKVQEAEMTQSMSRVGKCIDNGPMEGFFGTLKTEMFYGKKFKTLEELKTRIVEYIEFYNKERFQKKLGCMAPLEYRNHASICA